jgi:uncharacterized OsmC-like protein
MKMASTTHTGVINGIDTDGLRELVEQVVEDPRNGMTSWRVATHWKGGTRSDTKVSSYAIGGRDVEKNWTIPIDEPLEIGGTNRFANPQEYLLAAFNACQMVGYVALAALEGIELEDVRIETNGDIDLRGFLGLDPNVAPGYENISYTVYLKGNGTPEQFRKIHEAVMATAPNRYNLAAAISLHTKLVVE